MNKIIKIFVSIMIVLAFTAIVSMLLLAKKYLVASVMGLIIGIILKKSIDMIWEKDINSKK